MKQEKIAAVLDRKISKLAGLSGEIAGGFDADVIHDFRVAVKSLRALMRMFAEARGEKFKLPKKFKRLYHITGNIREAQLELAKMREVQLYLPGYEKYLRSNVRREMKNWSNRDAEKAITGLERRVIRHLSGKITSSSFRDFINSRLLSVHNLCMSPQVTDDMVHSMRKLLKDIMYVHKVAKKEAPHFLDNFAVDIERIDYCTGLLGDYNDARIMLGRIAAYSPHSDDVTEKQLISQLCIENAPKLESEKKRIISELLSLTYLQPTTAGQTETVLPELSPAL